MPKGVTHHSLIDDPDNIDSLLEDDIETKDNSSSTAASSEDVIQQNPIEAPDTLDSLLDFLKTSGSPVSGLLDLRSLLLEQKEEKVMLRTLVDQMKVDITGLRYNHNVPVSNENIFNSILVTSQRLYISNPVFL